MKTRWMYMPDLRSDSMNSCPYRLTSCVWEITLACCFSCKYCGSKAGKARRDELSTDECLDICDQLNDLGCRRVNLIGGEVFMRRDWRTIVQRLSEYGIRVTIITNGFLFTEDIIRDLRDLDIESVAVSLDGVERVHDRYRQPGSYARAVKAIEALTGAGIVTTMITTLNAENVLSLEELYAGIRRYPLAAWQLQACSPMGNAAATGVDVRFDPNAVIGFVVRHRGDAPFPIGIADNIGYFTADEGLIRGDPYGRRTFPGCGAGLSVIGIDSVGNVRGCESMYDARFIEGNLRETPLRDIWENPDGFAYNRRFTPDLLTGECASCEYGAYCGGGCRSYNFFVHRKLYEYPNCARSLRDNGRNT